MSSDGALAIVFAVAATLYGAVGHGGASAYLVVMALAGFVPAEMRVTALLMNIAVSAVGTVLFSRNFRWRLFWPFAAAAVPAAWLGGMIHVHPQAFYTLMALALLGAAFRLFLPERPGALRVLCIPWAIVAGGLIGITSGLTGIGGGIFLTPLLILARWASPREAAAVSAAFILANSVAGLSGLALAGGAGALRGAFPLWLAAALCGGSLGAFWGSHRARPAWLRSTLGLVLVIAAVKFGVQSLQQ